MIFRQLFEPDSSTYTYLLACPDSREVALIDPVLETVERDLDILQQMGLKLGYTIETHLHADHITGAYKLKALTGCKICGPAFDELPCTDIGLKEGEPFMLGNIVLNPLFTPGHTDTHHAYILDTGTHAMLFSGDALLIDSCGRTDFQSGDASTLYRSIHTKFFTLPDDTLVYPAHDYDNRCVSTIAQEKKRNPRLSGHRTEAEFVALMNRLDLPYPRKIDISLPGNQQCGRCPDNMPEAQRGPCAPKDQG